MAFVRGPALPANASTKLPNLPVVAGSRYRRRGHQHRSAWALRGPDRWRTRTVEVMQCPHDQTVLQMTERQGIEIDYCPTCRGVWLDRGASTRSSNGRARHQLRRHPAASRGTTRAPRSPATRLDILRNRPTRNIRPPGARPRARTARTTTTVAGTTLATRTRRSASLSLATCSTSDRLPQDGAHPVGQPMGAPAQRTRSRGGQGCSSHPGPLGGLELKIISQEEGRGVRRLWARLR